MPVLDHTIIAAHDNQESVAFTEVLGLPPPVALGEFVPQRPPAGDHHPALRLRRHHHRPPTPARHGDHSRPADR
ncbi:MAG: hypothetical protein ACRDIL_20355 [Candidatus Limnocylindrales bacterium]